MIAPLDLSPQSAVAMVQGWLFHVDHLDRYPVDTRTLADRPRATRSVRARLDELLQRSSLPLDQPRPYAVRVGGTCRDYALLTTALLREGGFEARVRCGFADYLSEGRWEDHWVCEYRCGRDDHNEDASGLVDRPGWDRSRWRIADAQIDGVHRSMLGVAFNAADVPRERFVMGDDAARTVLRGEREADAFGHGDARGEWFVVVNLCRDVLALTGRETSAWDAWRDATLAERSSVRLAHYAQLVRSSAPVDVPEPLWMPG